MTIARPAPDRPRAITPEEAAAIVAAYQGGEPVLEIVKRTSFSRSAIYRAFRRMSRIKRWCEWCGDDLIGNRKRFCSNQCRNEYNADPGVREDAGTLHRCGHCNKPLPTNTNKKFCDRSCRQAKQGTDWRNALRTIGRMEDYANVTEIAKIFGMNASRVKAALAEIKAAREAAKTVKFKEEKA